jgi:hypothetical protein
MTAFTIDAHGQWDAQNVSSDTLPAFTTTKANDVLILAVSLDASTNVDVSGVSGGGLTWALRKKKITIVSGPLYCDVEEWWAYQASAGSVTVVVSLSGTAIFVNAACIAVNGCTTPSSPFDSNSSVPASGSSESSINISTSNSYDFIIGLLTCSYVDMPGFGSGYSPWPGTGSGSSNYEYGSGFEYQIVSQKETNFAVNFSESNPFCIVADALAGTLPSVSYVPSCEGDGLAWVCQITKKHVPKLVPWTKRFPKFVPRIVA